MEGRTRTGGFTLIEVMIAIAIMAILATMIIMSFVDASGDANLSAAKQNLRILRGQLEAYRTQHGGKYPPTFSALAGKTNFDHTTSGSPPFGPYCLEVPVEPNTKSHEVATTSNDPIAVTGTTGGWIYNAATGEIRVNHEDFASL